MLGREAFVPLIGNFTAFTSPRGERALERRVKQMLLLAEKILFESGYVLVWGFGPEFEGEIPHWDPANTRGGSWMGGRFQIKTQESTQIDDAERLLEARRAQAALSARHPTTWERLAGEEVLLTIACLEPLIEDWGLSGVDGVATHVRTAAQEEMWVRPTDPTETRLFTKQLPPLSKASTLDSWLRLHSGLDLCVAADLGAPLVTDESHGRFLRGLAKMRKDRADDYSGGLLVMNVLFPNVTSLAWEQVLELRRHPAVRDFRTRVREWAAAALTSPDPERKVLERVNADLVNALRNRIPRLHRRGGEITASVALDLLGGVVPFAGSAVTSARQVAQWRRSEGEWTALFLKLWETNVAMSD